MGEYLVRYFSDTAVELGKTLNFEMPGNVRIVIRDDIQRDAQDVPVKFGFVIDATCHVDSRDQAIEATNSMVEGVVGVISFSLSAVVNPCIPAMVLDVTRDTTEREILQYLPLPSRIRPSRKFREEAFTVFWDHLEGMPPEEKTRILRAIRWYRKAIIEDDPFDQFMNLWTGIEVINESVKRKYKFPHEKPLRSCPSCGTAVLVQPTLSGIEYLVVNLHEQAKETWHRILEVRNGLVHGFGELNYLINEMRTLIPVLRNALLKGVLDLMGMTKENRLSLLREPLRNVPRPHGIASALIHNLPIEDILSGKASPRLEIVKTEVTTRMDEKGMKHEKEQFSLKLQGYEGSWSPQWLQVVAEKDPEDVAAEISVVTE